MKFFEDKKFEHFQLGDGATFTKKYTIDDFWDFAKLSGDYNPLHHNPQYSLEFSTKEPIVPIHLSTLVFSAIAGMIIPGIRSLYLSSSFKSLVPLKYNQEVTYSARIVALNETHQIITLKVIAYQNIQVMIEGELNVKVRVGSQPDVDLDQNIPPTIRPCYFSSNDRPWSFITGASGDLGRSVAKNLALKKHNLILQYASNSEKIKQLISDLKDCEVEIQTIQCNFTDPNSRVKLCVALNELTRISNVIHCASSPVMSSLESLMATNFQAMYDIHNVVLPKMLANQSGKIINVGSVACLTHPLGWDNYVAAKNAVSGLMNKIDSSYKKYGIRGYVIAPTFIEGLFSEKDRSSEEMTLEPEEVADQIAGVIDNSDDHFASYINLFYGRKSFGEWGFHSRLSTRPGKQTDALVNNTEFAKTKKTEDFSPTKGIEPLSQVEEEILSTIRKNWDLPHFYEFQSENLELIPGWDSMSQIQLILALEKKFNLKFSSNKIESSKNINGLTQYIKLQLSTSPRDSL